MNKKFPSLHFISCLLFLCLLFLGFRLASQRALWGDEICSQYASVERISYERMLQGLIPEGNISPLYYLGQKITGTVLHYRSPYIWVEGNYTWDFDHVWDRIFMRVFSVMCGSLMIVFIFYYFTKYYSWGTGSFSIFLCFSTAMVWSYWAEARPYALWMLLTTLQMLLFLRIVQQQGDRSRLVNALAAVHILLVFTVSLSLPQIVVVACLLWFYGIRDWQRYVFVLFLPLLVWLSYFWIRPRQEFALGFTFEQYIRANISRDRWHVLIIFGLCALATMVPEKFKIRRYLDRSLLQGLPILWIVLGLTAAACAVLLLLKLTQGTAESFAVTEKYFIYLAPTGIIAITLFVDRLMTAVKNRWVKILFICGIAGLVVPRFLKVMNDLNQQYPHLF